MQKRAMETREKIAWMAPLSCLRQHALKSMKNQIKTIMCRVRGGVPMVLSGLLLSTAVLSSGCSSCATRQRTLGADLSETIEMMTDNTDPLDELSSSIDILFGPEWGEFMDTICRLSR